MKPYLILILFFLTPFWGCTPSTDTALLQGDIPTPEELALAVSQSDIYKDFSSAASSLRENEAFFSVEDLQAWAANTNVTEDQVIDYMVKNSNISKDKITAFLSISKDIEQRLLNKFGEPLKQVYADQILLDRYRSSFRKMTSRKTPTFGEKNTVCGPEYSLDCPGTRDCYYGNNLDTYFDTCEQTAYDNAWIFLEASVLVGTAGGAGLGSIFAGIGAGPGAVLGALGGAAAGGLGAIITISNANTRCRLDLSTLCALCQARCVEI